LSRFASLPRTAAAAALLALAGLIALGLWLQNRPEPPGPGGGSRDVALYRAIVGRVKTGQPYEAAAVAEHRAGLYPLKPFVVVRPPLLAEALARLPDERTGDRLLAALAAAVIVAWTLRLRAALPGPAGLALSALAVFTGVNASLDGGGASLFHETWAGLLIALSLAARSERRFAAAVALGLLAALVRELALPYLLVMAAIALAERRRTEAAAFAGAAAAALAALALHARALAPLVGAHDLASPGWVRLGGWAFVLATTRWNLLVVAAGPWMAALVAPLGLAGALGWKDPAGLRLATVLFGYTLGFMAVGRPENQYWGLLVSPLLGVGLALALPALADLGRRALRPQPA
jgi:hypothetical protein